MRFVKELLKATLFWKALNSLKVWIRLENKGVYLSPQSLVSYNDVKSRRIVFGDSVVVGKNVRIEGDVSVGEHTYFSDAGLSMVVSESASISIGSYCSIARNFHAITSSHHISEISTSSKFYDLLNIANHKSKGNISIGNDVWIGANTIILGNVVIGDGAIIGAGSLVTKNIEPCSIYAGVPAKFLRWRFPERQRAKYSELKFWETSKTEFSSLYESFSHL